ncbi:histidine kinase [Clostridium tetani]|nr:histidine kinase [Clostridium tetani]QBD87890.1 histidine kinase [Clostridium tetani]
MKEKFEKSEEYMEKIKEICLKNTSLSESDIKIIQNISKTLQFVADSSKADVFIDCMTKNQKCAAVVVASAKTRDAKSFYKEDVVGKLAIRKNEPAVLRTLQTGIPSRDIKAITQENIIVKQNVEPIKNEKDEVIAVIISEQDITEDLRESKKLKILAETNEELMCQLEGKKIKYEDRNITYHIDDAILIFDESGILRFKNPVAEELYEKLGYDQELVGMSFSNLALSNVSIEELIKGESIEVEEINIGEMYFQIKYIVQSNKVLKLAMLIRDITDMKEKEKELILKSVAIKEIHHRVKNNLQTIASLLRLQSRRIKGKEFRVAINESINRILSIAITHEMLAKEGIDDVNIKEVINKIKSYIVSFEKNEKLDLTIEIIGDDLAISSDKSTAIALVVNEAIQNCLKHAFKGREKGKITIKVEKGNAYSEISVIDDGIGFDVNSASQSSLGLMIINSLVSDKLKGNLEIQSTSNGTTVNFDFEN